MLGRYVCDRTNVMSSSDGGGLLDLRFFYRNESVNIGCTPAERFKFLRLTFNWLRVIDGIGIRALVHVRDLI